MKPEDTPWLLRVAAPSALRDAVSAALADTTTSQTDLVKENVLEAVFSSAPDRAALTAKLARLASLHPFGPPEFTLSPLPVVDWLVKVAQDYPPRHFGRLVIFAQHQKAPWVGRWRVEIEATTAFGTGEHPTTAGCLRLLLRLRRARPNLARVLDVGCGTGILGLAAARAWPMAHIRLNDNDAEAIRITRQQAARNHLLPRVRALTHAGVPRTLVPRTGARADLLLANILLNPLRAMAPQLARALRPGGTLIVSGIMTAQENALLARLRPHGLRLVARAQSKGWSALRLCNTNGTVK